MNRKSFIKTTALGFGAIFQIPFSNERIPVSDLQYAFDDSADPGKMYDVLIIGGSFAGLSAAMGLGRCRRSVLVIDEGQPRNRTSPQANNVFSRDGHNPKEILGEARNQLTQYKEYLAHLAGHVNSVEKEEDVYSVSFSDGRKFRGQSLVFAGGVTDDLLDIPGLEALWGNGVYHCPYCHGWENRDKKTVIIGSGNSALGLASTVSNWTSDITYFSQGEPVNIPDSSHNLLAGLGISIREETISGISRDNDAILVQRDGHGEPISFEACYAPGRITANSELAQSIGCEMRPNGSIIVNEQYETNVHTAYAIGDICSRSNGQVIHAAYSGTVVAASINTMFLNKRFDQ